RSLRGPRLFPVSLPPLRRTTREDAVPGRARPFSSGVHAPGAAPLAGRLPGALLRKPVQAVVLAGWTQSRNDQPLAPGRLADAERCPGRSLAGGAGRAGPIPLKPVAAGL